MVREGRISERGQMLMVVATALFFVLLGATAVAVDLGAGVLQKRRLQSTSDAAALAAAAVLSQGGTQGEARAEAERSVSSNLGRSFTFPASNVGVGVNLTEGFEVSGAAGNSVRVGLKRDVRTMFAPVLGVSSVTVAARSHATVGRSGVLPIAVKRFSGGNTAVPLDAVGQPNPVSDYVRPALNDVVDPRVWPSLTAPPPNPAGYSPPWSYDASVSGQVIPILGLDAKANVANGSDFHFWVIPDLRHISNPPTEYYNGVNASTSAQQMKDISSSYLWPLRGYTGPNPLVGEELGILSGVVTKEAVRALRKSFKRGDVVTAMIYDGTVQTRPTFVLSVTPLKQTVASLDPPAEFKVDLVPKYGFTTQTGSVRFWATGLEGWADWSFGSYPDRNWGATNQPYELQVPYTSAPVPVYFKLTPTASTPPSGTRSAMIMAYYYDNDTVASATATVLLTSSDVFTVSTGEAFKRVEQGSSTRFALTLTGENSYRNLPSDLRIVTTTPMEWFNFNFADPTHPQYTGVSGWDGPDGIKLSIPNNDRSQRLASNGSVAVDITAGATTTPGTYMVRLLLQDGYREGATKHDQEVFLVVQVIRAGSSTTSSVATNFIQVLGYANFVVTYYMNSSTETNEDSNTVYGYAVSGLASSPDLLNKGLAPRLVPWQ